MKFAQQSWATYLNIEPLVAEDFLLVTKDRVGELGVETRLGKRWVLLCANLEYDCQIPDAAPTDNLELTEMERESLVGVCEPFLHDAGIC